MTRLPPSPFVSISSSVTSEVAALCGVSVVAAGAVVPPSASAVSNSESAAPIPARESAPNSAGADLQIPAPAAFSVSDTQYIPELFSVYAARRCKDLISPPLPKVERNIDELMLNAVGAALNLHPRDLDNDPLPAFLRSPVFAPEPTRGIVESLLKLARLSA
jgi:hypothetical protein